jgi:hypothetical protein
LLRANGDRELGVLRTLDAVADRQQTPGDGEERVHGFASAQARRGVLKESRLLVRVTGRRVNAVHIPRTSRGFDVREVKVHRFVAVLRLDGDRAARRESTQIRGKDASVVSFTRGFAHSTVPGDLPLTSIPNPLRAFDSHIFSDRARAPSPVRGVSPGPRAENPSERYIKKTNRRRVHRSARRRRRSFVRPSSIDRPDRPDRSNAGVVRDTLRDFLRITTRR